MTVYECIQELSRYPSDKKVVFHFTRDFYVDGDKAVFDDDIEVKSIEEHKGCIIVNFTN